MRMLNCFSGKASVVHPLPIIVKARCELRKSIFVVAFFLGSARFSRSRVSPGGSKIVINLKSEIALKTVVVWYDPQKSF
jgi:hypothetical protein